MSEQEEGRRKKEGEGRKEKEGKEEGRKEGRKEGEGRSETTRRIDSDDCIFIKGDNKHEHLNNIVLHRRQKDIYKTVFT